MTKQELLDFCVENAGKMASGNTRTAGVNGLLKQQGKLVSGKITAFTIDQYGNALILLEDAKGKENKDLPNPLPGVPHHMGGWFRVVSPAKLGFPVYADSVVVTEQVSDEVAQVRAVKQAVQAKEAAKSYGRICRPQLGSEAKHSVCDPDWCHLKYIGVS